MIEEQRIIDAVRKYLELPDYVSDAGIIRNLKESHVWGRVKLRLAITDFRLSIVSAIKQIRGKRWR
jgi:hypothetical protein